MQRERVLAGLSHLGAAITPTADPANFALGNWLVDSDLRSQSEKGSAFFLRLPAEQNRPGKGPFFLRIDGVKMDRVEPNKIKG